MNNKHLGTSGLVYHIEHHLDSAREHMSISSGLPRMSPEDTKLTILMLVMALEKQCELNDRLVKQIEDLKIKKPWYSRFIKLKEL